MQALSKILDVIVTTCDEDIKHVIEERGAVVMTADTHDRATDGVQGRLNHYPQLDDCETGIMVQGDELLVSPGMISGH